MAATYGSYNEWKTQDPTGWGRFQQQGGESALSSSLGQMGVSSEAVPGLGVPNSPGNQQSYFGPVPYPEYDSILQGGAPGTMITGTDPMGRPTMSPAGEYRLPSELTIGSEYDPSYLNNLQAYATAEDPSTWLDLQQQSIASKGATARDTLEQQRLGGLGEARENLAMRRGLSTGAGERLEESGMEAKMMENQRLSRDLGEQSRMMEIAEQEAKLGVLEKLPGYEMQRAGMEADIDRVNIANILGEREREFGAKMDAYNTQMQTWAAQQQAQATEAASGGGGGGGMCFITTAVCEYLGLEDDNEILNAFRDLRDNFMKKDINKSEQVEEYYKIAPIIVEKIKADSNYETVMKDILHSYLIPAFKFIKEDKKAKAYSKYVSLVTNLKEKYL